jgi:hypothetical protein
MYACCQLLTDCGQACSIYHYERLKIKVLKCSADIFFNSLFKKVIPKYANIKVPTTSPAALMTKSKAQITRIKEKAVN